MGPFPDGIRELEANDPNGSLASLGTNLELPTNLVLPKYLTHCQATSLVLERKGEEFFVKWRYTSSEVTDGACGSAVGGDANCNAARG